MTIQFLRGNPQTPRGHAILFARASGDARTIYCTYCVVPPIPMSIAKWLPPMLAAQLPAEELREATNITGTPIPPMLEEVSSLDYLDSLAERREDDLCDMGTMPSRDEMTRMQMAITGSQEYGQLYASHASHAAPFKPVETKFSEPIPLDELDTDELLYQTMPDRQKLAELGKLIGTVRYAIEGNDAQLQEETKTKMLLLSRLLAEKYRGKELVKAATNPDTQGAKLAELYLSRAYKLLDEEYADIPGIERSIRELQE